jgi:very-short-patch-repair endonuclease
MPDTTIFHYNAPKITFERAKRLRKRMTKVEKMLWNELRRNQLKGYYFRRQHPISYYIADFYCHAAKLVIEVDGPTHHTEEGRKKDERRDKAMKEFQLTILRFRSEEVFVNLDKVVQEIEKSLP